MLSRAAIATLLLTALAAPALSAVTGGTYDPTPPAPPAPVTAGQATQSVPVAPAPAPTPPAAVATAGGEPGPKWKAEMAALRSQVADLKRQLGEQRRDNAKEIALLRRSRAARERDLLRALSKQPTVIHALEIGAAAYGVPAERLRRIAWCESNHIPTAQLGPYVGLFQFGTWLWGQSPFGRFERTDPYAAALAASWAFSKGYDKHWPICGKL